MKPIIEVKNVGKKYLINHERGRYIALRDVLTDIIKRPFSFIKIKARRAVGLEKREDFWALKDVSFSVNKGEVIGIIGRNGAGKSTLLKILSQITPPTEGEIILRGRVGSLLEVGTGFHPELTGRENIFLNGAILGMKRTEIAKKFDRIVEFSGVEKFLDTPVKRYSSGMYVRLAFSVAAHMEPDILIVDEVLAVGDAEFQKKCLGKMQEVTQTEGRTILFVSHNLSAIQSLCNKTVWIDRGQIRMIGDTDEVVNTYLRTGTKTVVNNLETYSLQIKREDGKIGTIKFTNITITDEEGSPLLHSHKGLKISLSYESEFTGHAPDARTLISIISDRSQRIVHRLDSHGVLETIGMREDLKPHGKIICETGPINLTEGRYIAEIDFMGVNNERLKMISEFDVITNVGEYGYRLNPDKSVCDYLLKYTFKQGA